MAKMNWNRPCYQKDTYDYGGGYAAAPPKKYETTFLKADGTYEYFCWECNRKVWPSVRSYNHMLGIPVSRYRCKKHLIWKFGDKAKNLTPVKDVVHRCSKCTSRLSQADVLLSKRRLPNELPRCAIHLEAP